MIHSTTYLDKKKWVEEMSKAALLEFGSKENSDVNKEDLDLFICFHLYNNI